MPIAPCLDLASLTPTTRRRGFGFSFACREKGRVKIFARRKRWKVFCKSEIEVLQVRRCSPLLESALLSSGNVSASNEWKAVPDIWKTSAERYGDQVALVDPYHDPPSELTYKQLELEILYFSEGLRVVGVNPDEKLALFADNSCRWLIADQGIMATGAINVVRGTRSSVEELFQIYNHSESIALVMDNPDFFNRLAETFISKAAIRFIILLWGEKSCLDNEVTQGIPIFNYKDILDLGRDSRQALIASCNKGQHYTYEAIDTDNIATLVYTSGTTGIPKGVMLTHRNLLHQIKNLWDIVPAETGDRFLSVLPPWHAYERACEYFIFTYGIEQVYTTVKNLKEDLRRYQPHYLISVPLVYETLYSKRSLSYIKVTKKKDEIQQLMDESNEQEAYVKGRTHEFQKQEALISKILEDFNSLKKQRDELQDTRKSLWKKESNLSSEIDRLKSDVVKAEKSLDHATPGITTSPTARKFVALALIKISLIYMEAKRVYEGKVLTKMQKLHLPFVVMFDWLWARIIAAILYPLHMLGMKLVYSKIHSAIGITKAGISGGGSLPSHIDRFFEAIGVKLQNGYGLTESSPVAAARLPECNVLGTVGPPLPHTEIKIVDSETGEDLPVGSKGIVKVRGPQVMKGYYKNPSATNEVLDEEGWLSTGDIGWITPNNSTGRSRHCGGMLVLEGRAKDTIVLTTGENVEPSELEEAAVRSSLINQIVVIGQDQRRLGALIVPNKDDLLLAAKNPSIIDANASELAKEKMMNLLRDELRIWTSECSFQIGPIFIVDEPFTIDRGLMTPTMKIRRDRVVAQYSDEIAKLYM